MSSNRVQLLKPSLQRLSKLISPPGIVLLLCLLLLTVSVIITQHTYSYTSDDVSWQTTLLTWKPFSGQHAYVGAKDNFLINVPFILLFGHIFHTTRA